jgi:hypothetical protein
MYLTSAGNQALAGTAKQIITDALLGMVVVLIMVILFKTINPDLLNITLGDNLISSDGISVTNNTPPNNSGQPGSCNGIATAGINSSQCGDVSQELGQMLECLNSEIPGLKITSISDDDAVGDLSRCQGSNYSHPPCDHAKNSCHYGGANNNSRSCALDISTRNANIPSGVSKQDIITAGSKCGAAYIKDESASSNHLHFSVSGCQCDGHS